LTSLDNTHARTGETKNTDKIIGKRKERDHSEDTGTDGWEVVNWMHLAQDKDQ